MGPPGALLTGLHFTTPGGQLPRQGSGVCLVDSTHGQQTPLQDSQTRAVSVVSGPGIDCLGVVLPLLAVTQAQPHRARCGEEQRPLCPLRCPPHRHLSNPKLQVSIQEHFWMAFM